jgi:hypothetical protein
LRIVLVEPQLDCIRRCRGATFAGMRPISNPRAKDVLLYVSSLPDRDRLAVMEAMRDVFPQLKHDGIWSSECERLWREVGDGRLHGERIMNRAFRIAHRLRREMQGAASAPYLG